MTCGPLKKMRFHCFMKKPCAEYLESLIIYKLLDKMLKLDTKERFTSYPIERTKTRYSGKDKNLQREIKEHRQMSSLKERNTENGVEISWKDISSDWIAEQKCY